MSSDEENLEEIYDKMFSYRYTDDDPEYVKTCSIGIPPGACVANYFNRPKRNYDKNPYVFNYLRNKFDFRNHEYFGPLAK